MQPEPVAATAPMTDFGEDKQPRRITYVLVTGKPFHYRTHMQASIDRGKIFEATGQKPRLMRSLNVSKQEVQHFQPAPEMLALLRRCQRYLCHPEESIRFDLLKDVNVVIAEATSTASLGVHGGVEP